MCPLTPQAIMATGFRTMLLAAWLEFCKIATAGRSTMGRLLDNVSGSLSLSSSTCRGAVAPSIPDRDHTILFTLHVSAMLIAFLSRAGIARNDLFHGAIARLSGSSCKLLNDTISFLNAETAAAALRPLIPLSQHTILVEVAGLQVSALLELLAQANRWLATAAGLDCYISASGLVGHITRCRTSCPTAPASPFAVSAGLVTRHSIARRHLAFVVRNAETATMLWRHCHVSLATLGPAIT
mmetsp:Transcript_59779/g.142658  ORF Transcript_59779/g.142658 Transcript_59779/m.142658 type:complete len:240 (-) Transcript_59779:1307-2026(-)